MANKTSRNSSAQENKQRREAPWEPPFAGINPWSVLQAGIKAVPALKYALAVLAIASAIALIKGFGVDYRVAALGVVVMLVLMTALVVFAALTKVKSNQIRIAALVLMWSFLWLTILSATMLFTSAFFGFPKEIFAGSKSDRDPPVEISAAQFCQRFESLNRDRKNAFESSAADPTNERLQRDFREQDARFREFIGKFESRSIKNWRCEILDIESKPRTYYVWTADNESSGDNMFPRFISVELAEPSEFEQSGADFESYRYFSTISGEIDLIMQDRVNIGNAHFSNVKLSKKKN